MQYSDFRKFVRYKRKQQGSTLNNFAFDSNIEPSSLSRFENGKSDILFNNFVKIAKNFGKTPGEFLLEFENCKNIID